MTAAWFFLWGAAAVVQDLRLKKVSVKLLRTGCLGGALLAMLSAFRNGVPSGARLLPEVCGILAGGLLPGILTAGISRLTDGALGMADAWFVAAAGFCFGAFRTFWGSAAAVVLAGVFSLAGVAAGKLTRKSRLPFIPFLYAGMAWVVLGGGRAV